MLTLALEVFHCLPDELLDRIDASAERTGRRWQDVLGELLAYYTLKHREEQTDQNKKDMAAYLSQSPETRGKLPGTFGADR